MNRAVLLVCVAGLLIGSSSVTAQARTVSVKGVVTDSVGRAAAGAAIVARVAQERWTATADAEGRFIIAVPAGTRDVVLEVRAIGMRPRVMTVRPDVELTIRLQSVFTQLSAVGVLASPRERPARSEEALASDPLSVEQMIGFGGVGVTDQGQVAAMAAAVPGVTAVEGSDIREPAFSTLGLPPDQNVVRIDGLRVRTAALPRDVESANRLSNALYDPTRGGFSAAQFAIRTLPGRVVPAGSLHMTLDAPQLQVAEPLNRSFQQQPRDFMVSGVLSGPIGSNRATYLVSGQLQDRVTPVVSLFDASPSEFSAVALDPDSAGALTSFLRSSGLGAAGTSGPNRRRADNVFVRFDGPKSTRSVTTVEAFALRRSTSRLLSGVGSTPDNGAMASTSSVNIVVGNAHYGANNELLEVWLGATRDMTAFRPLSVAPGSRVLMTADALQQEPRAVSIGGSGAVPQSATFSSFQGFGRRTWFTVENRHRLTFGGDFDLDAGSQFWGGASNGVYTFPSFAAFAARTPALYTRQLQPVEGTGRVLNAGIGVSDEWRIMRTVRLRYGVRGEIGRVLSANQQMLPDDALLSPRVAMSWTYGRRTLAAGPLFPATPVGVVTVGSGLFRDALHADVLTAAGASSAQTLACAGGGPIPASELSDPGLSSLCSVAGAQVVSAPNSAMYDPGFRAPRSWRSSASWSAAVVPYIATSVEVLFSLDRRQPSVVDDNLRHDAVAVLAAEENRPIYADWNDPLFTPPITQSRVDAARGAILRYGAGGLSQTRQLSVSIAPRLPSTGFAWGLVYVRRDVQLRGNGFSTTTRGDPRVWETARSPFDIPHQFAGSIASRISGALFATLYGRLNSGAPYSPVVDADVNGDRRANDRAFVFDPVTGPLALRAGMETLLASAPASARRCLQHQIGTIAGPSSCRRPWTSDLTLQVGINPRSIGLPERAYLSLGITNALDALDRAVSPRERRLGAVPAPDPVLLFVRGFNASTQAFDYEINPRFGHTTGRGFLARPPLRFTLELRVAAGRGPAREIGRAIIGKPATDRPGASLVDLRRRLAESSFNLAAVVLLLKDSIGLSQEQVRRIESVQTWYPAALDSAVAAFAERLVNLPARYDDVAAMAEISGAQHAAYRVLLRTGELLAEVLTPAQRVRLPTIVNVILDRDSGRLLRPVQGVGFGRTIFR